MLLRAGVEIGEQAVEICLGQRIELVVVAAATTKTETKKDSPHGLYAVGGIFIEVFSGQRPALHSDGMVAQESGGKDLRGFRIRKQVPRKLFHHKLIKGHVAVVGLDDPVAPGPTGSPYILQIAIAVAVACQIEPARRHVFAVAGRGKQSRHLPLIRTGLLIPKKGVELFRGWR